MISYKKEGVNMLYLLLLGCGTINTARPLPEGAQALSATFGGPMVAFGEGYVPLPNLVVEHRIGMPQWSNHALDVNYGLNLTTIAFDQIGLHVGASTLLLDQNGGVPAVSVATKTFVYNNYLSKGPAESEGIWAAQTFDLTTSWQVKSALFYLGGRQALDYKSPSFLLTPFVGVEIGKNGIVTNQKTGSSFQLEFQHYGTGRINEASLVEWRTIQDTGAFGFSFGYSNRFDKNSKN